MLHRTILTITLSLSLGVLSSSCGSTSASATATTAGPGTRASMTVFYDSLAGHGDWVYVTSYGWVWRPSLSLVGPDFYPYVSGGYWLSTSSGWFFTSTYPFAWATYHYGYWVYDPFWGWVWIPDTIWAPSWVDWRVSVAYVGWAPLPPPTIRDHRSHWAFVGAADFTKRDLRARVLEREHASRALAETRPERTVFAKGSWYRGPSRQVIAGATGTPVKQVELSPPERGAVQRVVVRDHRVRREVVPAPRTQPPTKRDHRRPETRRAPPTHSAPAPTKRPVRRDHRRGRGR